MANQKYNDELRDLQVQDFQRRDEPQFPWKSICAMYQALPALRGFWPMSSVAYTAADQARDLSVQGNHLTNNNSSDFGFFTASLIPQVDLDGTNQSLSRADAGAGNWGDVLGTEAYISSAQRGLTVGCWVYFDRVIGTLEYPIAKWGNALGNRSYNLLRSAGGLGQFTIGDGIGTDNVQSAALASDEWHLMIGRFTPSTQIDLFADNVQTTNAVGIPAALLDSTSNFLVGARSDLNFHLDGKISMVFLCAAALSDALIKQVWEQSRVMFNK